MRARDWRDIDSAAMHDLYAGELARWRDALSWDTTATWPIVDRGRRLGTVAGAVAFDDDGEPAGWCFALLQNETFQVGGFVARSEAATAALFEALATSPMGRAARRWIWFGWFDAPGLDDALATQGATLARYVYLRRMLRGPDESARHAGTLAPPSVRGWRASDLRQLSDLLASAYPTQEESRPFAPSGRIDEWREYAAQIVGEAGCGRFDPGLSLAVDGEGGTGHLDGVAVVTRVAPTTAHLAQLAVRAGAQARGLGRAMLAQALDRASARGCTAITLLVHERNARARRLYRAAGFEERAAFLSALRDVYQPWTSSSEALPTGGVSTRR